MLKDPSSLELGTEIRRRREALGWTLQELADRADMSANYIGTIENGLRDPSVSTLRAIARGFGIEPGELLTLVPELSPEAVDIAKLVDKVPPEVRQGVWLILSGFLKLRRK